MLEKRFERGENERALGQEAHGPREGESRAERGGERLTDSRETEREGKGQ